MITYFWFSCLHLWLTIAPVYLYADNQGLLYNFQTDFIKFLRLISRYLLQISLKLNIFENLMNRKIKLSKLKCLIHVFKN